MDQNSFLVHLGEICVYTNKANKQKNLHILANDSFRHSPFLSLSLSILTFQFYSLFLSPCLSLLISFSLSIFIILFHPLSLSLSFLFISFPWEKILFFATFTILAFFPWFYSWKSMLATSEFHLKTPPTTSTTTPTPQPTTPTPTSTSSERTN